MAGKAHVRLADFREHTVAVGMDLVTGRAGQPAALVFAAVPVAALTIAVAADTGFDLQFNGGRAACAEVHVHQGTCGGAFGIADVRLAGSVAGLAARGACVRLDAVRGLVDRQHRLRFGFVMAAGADRVALQRAVRFVSPRCGRPTDGQCQTEYYQHVPEYFHRSLLAHFVLRISTLSPQYLVPPSSDNIHCTRFPVSRGFWVFTFLCASSCPSGNFTFSPLVT